jgi:hypothetical protein
LRPTTIVACPSRRRRPYSIAKGESVDVIYDPNDLGHATLAGDERYGIVMLRSFVYGVLTIVSLILLAHLD